MIILTRKKEDKIGMVIIFALVFLGQVVIYLKLDAIGALILSEVIYSYFAIHYLVVEGRTIILDENGYTIKLLWYEKCYRWDQLKVKRVDFIRYTSDKNAVFAPYPIYKPGRWSADIYSFYFHPLTMIYIGLMPKWAVDYNKKNKTLDEFPFSMEEERFFEKMKEWNVELEIMKKPLKVR